MASCLLLLVICLFVNDNTDDTENSVFKVVWWKSNSVFASFHLLGIQHDFDSHHWKPNSVFASFHLKGIQHNFDAYCWKLNMEPSGGGGGGGLK